MLLGVVAAGELGFFPVPRRSTDRISGVGPVPGAGQTSSPTPTWWPATAAFQDQGGARACSVAKAAQAPTFILEERVLVAGVDPGSADAVDANRDWHVERESTGRSAA